MVGKKEGNILTWVGLGPGEQRFSTWPKAATDFLRIALQQTLLKSKSV